MKTPSPQPPRTDQPGFTLVEMIGVLSVLAILAAVIAPNALRTLDRAAVRAEAETLHNLGEQVKIFLKAKGWAPGLKPTAPFTTWDQDLADYADINSANIITNKRQMARVFVVEPAISPSTVRKRAMILSSMHNGFPLGPAATAVAFAAVWDWNTANLTLSPPPAGWNNWNNTNLEYLVIERINLAPVYNTDLQYLPITINNKDTVTVSYDLVLANGTVQGAVNIPATTTVSLSLHPRDRINLYRAAGGNPASLDYSYVVSTEGRTFDFFAPLPITLNNKCAQSASYNVVLSNGNLLFRSAQAVPTGQFPPSPLDKRYPRERIDLFKTNGQLGYSYVIPSGSSGHSFELDATGNFWQPVP